MSDQVWVLYVTAFANAFLFVGLRSFQQINVIKRKYWFIVPTSYAMAAVEVLLIQQMAHNQWGWIVFWIGSGAGLGSVSATYLHERYLSR